MRSCLPLVLARGSIIVGNFSSPSQHTNASYQPPIYTPNHLLLKPSPTYINIGTVNDLFDLFSSRLSRLSKRNRLEPDATYLIPRGIFPPTSSVVIVMLIDAVQCTGSSPDPVGMIRYLMFTHRDVE